MTNPGDIKPLIRSGSSPEKLAKTTEDLLKQPLKQPEQASPIQVRANINPADYIRIQGKSIVIAKYMPDFSKGFNYEDAHKEILNKGLFIPPIETFMHHFLDVIEAYQGRQQLQLYDAAGNPISRDEVEDIYKYLTTAHKRGVWTWLSARFKPGRGFNNLNLETIIGIDASGNLQTKTEPLEQCLLENCYVDLTFNRQGLPTRKSRNQQYKQGENIYYNYPRPNYVAGFVAGSGGASLDCDRLPEVSDPLLGVRAAREK